MDVTDHLQALAVVDPYGAWAFVDATREVLRKLLIEQARLSKRTITAIAVSVMSLMAI